MVPDESTSRMVWQLVRSGLLQSPLRLIAFGFCLLFVLAGCAQVPNLVVSVSNQSFDIKSVDISVVIDGKTVVDKAFPVKDQHYSETLPMELGVGYHDIEIRANGGTTVLKDRFEVCESKAMAIGVAFFRTSAIDCHISYGVDKSKASPKAMAP